MAKSTSTSKNRFLCGERVPGFAPQFPKRAWLGSRALHDLENLLRKSLIGQRDRHVVDVHLIGCAVCIQI
jgi:hypothetical protein